MGIVGAEASLDFCSINVNLPMTMERKGMFTFKAALFTAILALFGLAVFAAPQGDCSEVTITGYMVADGMDLRDAVLVVELEDRDCLESKLQANGKFEFTIPANVKARLMFLKPGFLPKEVFLDTRNAMNTDDACQRNKKVEFDVQLKEALQHLNERHAGPVGYITFVNGTGFMRIRHDERMIEVVSEEEALKQQEY
jgi:hypothetical protein